MKSYLVASYVAFTTAGQLRPGVTVRPAVRVLPPGLQSLCGTRIAGTDNAHERMALVRDLRVQDGGVLGRFALGTVLNLPRHRGLAFNFRFT